MHARGGGVGCEYGKREYRFTKDAGCPPAVSEASMASRAWAWYAARSRAQFHREANVSVGYSKRGWARWNVRFSKDVDGNCTVTLEVRLRGPTPAALANEKTSISSGDRNETA